MEFVFACIISGLVGASLVWLYYHKVHFTSGTLKIDHSNPEKDSYRFEIDDLSKLNKKTWFILRIDHKADLSQK